MKGINELHLIGATMTEAIQLWANANFKNPPRIVSVTELPGTAKMFQVIVDDTPRHPMDSSGEPR